MSKTEAFRLADALNDRSGRLLVQQLKRDLVEDLVEQATAEFQTKIRERATTVVEKMQGSIQAWMDRQDPTLNVVLRLAGAESDSFKATVVEARRVWMEENPGEDGRDHVTPFDKFLY